MTLSSENLRIVSTTKPLISRRRGGCAGDLDAWKDAFRINEAHFGNGQLGSYGVRVGRKVNTGLSGCINAVLRQISASGRAALARSTKFSVSSVCSWFVKAANTAALKAYSGGGRRAGTTGKALARDHQPA